MLRFFKGFEQSQEPVQEPALRERYGVIGSVVGIVCNLILFGVKLAVGLGMNSIAVISDALNNLSDLGASFVALIGVKLSNTRPDREHPYGHGRMEYIAALVVSFLILLMGVELLQSAIAEIRSPSELQYAQGFLWVLLGTVAVKGGMFFFNRYLGRKINSSVLKATAVDSFNDAIATLAVILSAVLSQYTSFPIDGVTGLLVSILIFRSGYVLAKDTVGVLLGTLPHPTLLKKIEETVLEQEGIVGTHDLMVHDYGPGRMIATIHAEVPVDSDIVKIHEVIDRAERLVLEQLGVHLVIHMDPIITDCEETALIKAQLEKTLKELNPVLRIHDFRMSGREEPIYLIFDLSVPFEMGKTKRSELIRELEKRMKKRDQRFALRVQVDDLFE